MKIVWDAKKKDYLSIAVSLFIASFFETYTACLIVGMLTYIVLRYIQVEILQGEYYDDKDYRI